MAELVTDLAPVLVGAWGVGGVAVLVSGEGALAWLLTGALVGIIVALSPIAGIAARP